MKQFNAKFTYTENNGTAEGIKQEGSVAVAGEDFVQAAQAAVEAINGARGGGKLTTLTLEDTGEEVSDKPKVSIREQVKAQHDQGIAKPAAPLAGRPSGKPDGQ